VPDGLFNFMVISRSRHRRDVLVKRQTPIEHTNTNCIKINKYACY